jgi:AP endonuclease-1
MNDSLTPLASNKDRHANIGSGEIGLPAFHCIMNDARFKGMPLVLETPAASWKIWQGEIQALYALQGLPHRQDAWAHVAEKLEDLRKLEKEMEKSNSLAEGSKAAQRAAEGKPPLVKKKRKTKTKEERQVKTEGASEATDGRG